MSLTITIFEQYIYNGMQNFLSIWTYDFSPFSVLYISVHRCDNGYYYPYGGDAFVNRVGVGPGEGYSINMAWNGVSYLQ